MSSVRTARNSNSPIIALQSSSQWYSSWDVSTLEGRLKNLTHPIEYVRGVEPKGRGV